MMRKTLTISFILIIVQIGIAQKVFKGKFEQLDAMLPTPNAYRTGTGESGPDYWQQKVDYNIEVTLDDLNQRITGKEKITYHNNSPSVLRYLWVQLDQNVRAQNSDSYKITSIPRVIDTLSANYLDDVMGVSDFDGGFKIEKVSDQMDNNLPFIINKTMMRVDLPEPVNSGEEFEFFINWSYNINSIVKGRSGWEYFPVDDNYSYAIAQFYPRMAVFDDYNGWQNKQFLGSGEFALEFGDFNVKITVPADHVVAATGQLQNSNDVLTKTQLERIELAKITFDKPIKIITEEEAIVNESDRQTGTKTWEFSASNVRDFAFVSSRKFIWDAMAVELENNRPLAMSFYPKEGNPLWERESTLAVSRTLKTYSRMSVPYPYPVAISVHMADMGMEYPMICFNWGRPNSKGEYSDFLKWSTIDVIVHEVGHNFFPMIVNSDERQWTWMDEGLNSFLEIFTVKEWYPMRPETYGTPRTIVDYMKGEKDNIRPIMTNSEQITQFGNNAYAKPSAALFLLRNTIMGPELFDYSFKEYARRWAFKRPNPGDFFRTMEDASAIDLDWFWKGWFYTTDYVDVNLEKVEWFEIYTNKKSFEKRMNESGRHVSKKGSSGDSKDFSGGPKQLLLEESAADAYGELLFKPDDDLKMAKADGKNVYYLTFRNEGGLVSPIIIEWKYKDGTVEMEQIPAEIWRKNEYEVTKAFIKSKEVVNISIDPSYETADTNTDNNYFPKRESRSKFDEFIKSSGF